jgi:hypothetical protein
VLVHASLAEVATALAALTGNQTRLPPSAADDEPEADDPDPLTRRSGPRWPHDQRGLISRRTSRSFESGLTALTASALPSRTSVKILYYADDVHRDPARADELLQMSTTACVRTTFSWLPEMAISDRQSAIVSANSADPDNQTAATLSGTAAEGRHAVNVIAEAPAITRVRGARPAGTRHDQAVALRAR